MDRRGFLKIVVAVAAATAVPFPIPEEKLQVQSGYMRWDGETLTIQGQLTTTPGTIGNGFFGGSAGWAIERDGKFYIGDPENMNLT